MTKTITLTETEASDIQSAVFTQLVEVRLAVREGRGSFELEVRLEVLYTRLYAMRVEFAS